VIETQ
jgi:adenylate kinase family enzyme